MSVVGFDIGNDSCFIGVARRGGIDIVANEVSNRNTPAMVSFKDKARNVGEAAAGQYIVNSKNTISQFRRLIGRRFDEPEVQEEIKNLPYNVIRSPEGGILIRVNYNGEEVTFTPERILAMLMKKLAETAEKANGDLKLADSVIAVPAYFTDAQRRAYLDATKIAGVNCLRLMNENCAVALAYGIYRTDLSETEPINVAFCDLGHSSFTVTIAQFVKGKLKILGVGFDRNVGGRNFDRLLFDHFATEIQKKHKLNVRANPKATIRLLAACEKLKKVLSANASSKIAVESLMEDTDISFGYTRDEFEALVAPYLERLHAPMQQALSTSGICLDQLYSVEITGGATRVPAVQQLISKFFGKELSKSLNFDEAVARGCALQAAILSPLFKVRDFEINDVTQYPINFSWKWAGDQAKMELDESASEGVSSTNTIFPIRNPIPSSKVITLKRSNQTQFEIHAYYEKPELLSPGATTDIGKFSISDIPVKETATRVKVSTKLNIHGILVVSSVQLIEEFEEVEQPKEAKPAEGTQAESMDTTEAPKPKVVKKTHRTDLKFRSVVSEFSDAVIQENIESETQITLQDRILMETAEKKNAVESYIYEMREKLDGELVPFVTAEVKESFLNLLTDAENWLYEDGEDTTKSEYVAKLESLHKIGEPAKLRLRESQTLPVAIENLNQVLARLQATATGSDPKYAHIEKDELGKIVTEVNNAHIWLAQKLASQGTLPKTSDPVLLTDEVNRKAVAVDNFSRPILNKPKPVPKPEPKPEAPKPETSGSETAEAKDKPASGPSMETD